MPNEDRSTRFLLLLFVLILGGTALRPLFDGLAWVGALVLVSLLLYFVTRYLWRLVGLLVLWGTALWVIWTGAIWQIGARGPLTDGEATAWMVELAVVTLGAVAVATIKTRRGKR